MGEAHCKVCGAKATDDEKTAIGKLNHAVGLSRGIYCGVDFPRIVTSGFKKETKKPEPKPKEKITEVISEVKDKVSSPVTRSRKK